MKFNIQIKNEEISNFKIESNPSFGTNHIPITLFFDWYGSFEEPEVITIQSKKSYEMSCFNATLHYGQSIFEGMKAFALDNDKIGVFRLDDYAKRFKRSAQIMGMPSIPETVFKQSVLKFLDCCRDFIPKQDGLSLYLRPLLIANDSIIKVKSSDSFRFYIMASVVGSYFTAGTKGAKVFCDPKLVRAFPGGCGEAKTAANYALSLPSIARAKSLGYEQVLYLNSENHQFIDELGGMNFFLLKDNKVITPKLGGTILSGITRKSILEMATRIDLEPIEADINIYDVMKPGFADAVFASGTAATVVPISEIGFQAGSSESIRSLSFEENDKISSLRKFLEDCQRNRNSLSKKWLTIV